MKLKPASIHASRIENDVRSSAVHPNTLPPRQMGETERAERPRARYCMRTILGADTESDTPDTSHRDAIPYGSSFCVLVRLLFWCGLLFRDTSGQDTVLAPSSQRRWLRLALPIGAAVAVIAIVAMLLSGWHAGVQTVDAQRLRIA